MGFSTHLSVMEYDVWFFALAVPSVLIAGISKGGFGSGAAFVATPILALKLEPALAIGLMLPLLMLVDTWTLRPYWGKWDIPNAGVLIAGGFFGVILAVLFYQRADADLLRVLIGLISIAFVAYQLARATGILAIKPRPFSRGFGLFAGVVAGFTSFISHAGGPPAAMFLLSQKISKTTYQATTVLAFWLINIFKAVPYAILGIFTFEALWAAAMLAPVAVLGAAIGVYAHHRVPETVFFTITYTLLLGAGGKLLLDGLT
ncbi:MAG: sulfite exporter TauE/SafE family protein [Pseudomonadota bacterium]